MTKTARIFCYHFNHGQEEGFLSKEAANEDHVDQGSIVALGEAEFAIEIQYMILYSTPAIHNPADTPAAAPVAPMEFSEVILSP